jgi:hypothetical protein
VIYLRINGRDLSPYLRVQHDEGFDPQGVFQEPQFTGSSAFTEGLEFVSDAIGNREWTIPLLLDGGTRAGLHTLIQNINNDLYNGAQVEFATDDADSITYFTLERGRLDAEYQYFLVRSNILRATPTLWTRPYGSTGTSRLIASLPQSSAAIVQFPASGILGDSAAGGIIEVRVGSQVASTGRIIGFGIHSSASFSGIRGPSSTDFVAQTGATVRGYSGAVGSQALAIPISPTGASGVALTSYLTPPGGHIGRHRIFAIGRSRLDRAITLYARDRWGQRLGPTTAASQVSGNWAVIDLGEIQVPARASGQEAVPTQYVEIIGGGASGNVINASPALEINKLMYLPLDISPGLLRTQGAAGNSLLMAEGFQGVFIPGYDLDALYDEPADIGGVQWLNITGNLSQSVYGVVLPAKYDSGVNSAAPNATGFVSVGSGQQWGDTSTEARFWLTASGAAASPCRIEIYAKQRTPSIGFGLRFEPNPHSLALMSYGSAGASVMASAGIASTLASGVYAGHAQRMILTANGQGLAGYLGTAPAQPILTATHADVSALGWGALHMRLGSNITQGLPVVDYMLIFSLGAGASDMGAREYFRFEAYPEKRAYQGNASIFLADRSAAFRGIHPKLPPVGSPGPSGPAQVVVLQGELNNFLGNDGQNTQLFATERFRFLR